jgi:hypothetical protein
MKAFLVGCLKVLLVVACGIVLVHVWPVAIVPLVIGLGLILGCGALLLASLAALGAVGVVVVIGLLAAAAVLLAILSPVWIPVLLIVGLVCLVKKPGGSKPRTVASA